MKFSVLAFALFAGNMASAETSLTQDLRELQTQNEDDTLLHDESRNTDAGGDREFTTPQDELGASQTSGVDANDNDGKKKRRGGGGSEDGESKTGTIVIIVLLAIVTAGGLGFAYKNKDKLLRKG